mgnify:FL=1
MRVRPLPRNGGRARVDAVAGPKEEPPPVAPTRQPKAPVVRPAEPPKPKRVAATPKVVDDPLPAGRRDPMPEAPFLSMEEVATSELAAPVEVEAAREREPVKPRRQLSEKERAIAEAAARRRAERAEKEAAAAAAAKQAKEEAERKRIEEERETRERDEKARKLADERDAAVKREIEERENAERMTAARRRLAEKELAKRERAERSLAEFQAALQEQPPAPERAAEPEVVAAPEPEPEPAPPSPPPKEPEVDPEVRRAMIAERAAKLREIAMARQVPQQAPAVAEADATAAGDVDVESLFAAAFRPDPPREETAKEPGTD